MANGGIVITQGRQRTHNIYPWCVFRHQNLRLLQVPTGVVWVTFTHNNKDLAALIGGAGDKPLVAIEHPLIALPTDLELNIGCVT